MLDDDRSVAMKLKNQVAELNDENTRLGEVASTAVASISARDTRVRELERLLGQARLEATKAVTSGAVAGIDLEAAFETEESELLQAAQDTIARLQRDLRTREEELRQYQTTLKDIRLRAVEERATMEREIESLNEKLYAAKNEEVAKLRDAMGTLERGEVVTQVYYDQDTGTTNWMKEARGMEEMIQEKEVAMATLRRQADKAESELTDAKAQAASRDDEVAALEVQVEDLRNRKPSDKLKILVKKLRQQMKTKEEQLENLQEAIEKLRADVQEGASESSGASADPAQMEEMSRRQAKMVTQLKKMKEVITALKEKAQAQELELEATRPAADALELERRKIEQLEAEVARLRRDSRRAAGRPERSEAAESPPKASSDARVVELEQRIKQLQAHQPSGRVAAERDESAPRRSREAVHTSNRIDKSSPSMQQWETDKKNQKRIERQKRQIQEMSQQLQMAKESGEEWQLKASAAEKVQDQLKAKVMDLQRAAGAAAGQSVPPSKADLEKITASEPPQKKIVALDTEIRALQRRGLEKDTQIKWLESASQHDKEQANALEGIIEHWKNQLEDCGRDAGVDMAWMEKTNEDLKEAILGSLRNQQDFETKVLQMESTQLSLDFKATEEARKAVILQDRVADLEAKLAFVGDGTGVAAPAPRPTSRKPVARREKELELEGVIDKLRRVIEKQQVRLLPCLPRSLARWLPAFCHLSHQFAGPICRGLSTRTMCCARRARPTRGTWS
jgi:DNA repair exonuclease SbcCD ATPase subunit